MFDMEQYKHELELIEVSKADKTKLERLLNSNSIPRMCWEFELVCGSLLSTVIISAVRTVENKRHRQFKIC